MRRSVSFAVFLAVVVLGASALTAPPRNAAAVAPQKAESAEVKIDNFSFGPSTLTVAVGTTVTWTNRDDITPWDHPNWPPCAECRRDLFRSVDIDRRGGDHGDLDKSRR